MVGRGICTYKIEEVTPVSAHGYKIYDHSLVVLFFLWSCQVMRVMGYIMKWRNNVKPC